MSKKSYSQKVSVNDFVLLYYTRVGCPSFILQQLLRQKAFFAAAAHHGVCNNLNPICTLQLYIMLAKKQWANRTWRCI